MFVPDDTKKRRRLDKLTASEWYVYEAHCERRMAKTGLSDATNKEVAEREGLTLKTVQNAMWRLRKLGWLRVEEGGVRPLVGDFHPVDKKHAKPSLNKEAEAEPVPYTGSLFPDIGNDLPCTGKEVPYTGNNLPHTGNGAYIGTRARSDQPDQPVTSETSTHTPARPPLVLVTPTAGERVCVCGLTVSLELLRRFWRNQTPPPNNVEAMVGKAFDECFRHAQVREWVEKQTAPAEKPPEQLDPKSCPDCGGTGYVEPGGRGKGVARCPHAGLYEQFAEKVQARAHAPP